MPDDDTAQAAPSTQPAPPEPAPTPTPPESPLEVVVAPEAPAPALEDGHPAQLETTHAEAQTTQIPVIESLPAESESIIVQNQPVAPGSLAPPPPAPAQAPAIPNSRSLWSKALTAIQDRKRKKLDKIMEMLAAKGTISNDDVEKLLHVSHATATRYLAALEKEGRIVQAGKTGRSVRYTKVQ